MIISEKKYTNNISDLAMDVIKVRYVGDDYIKFKGILFNKKNNIVYETNNYKIPRERLKDWFQL